MRFAISDVIKNMDGMNTYLYSLIIDIIDERYQLVGYFNYRGINYNESGYQRYTDDHLTRCELYTDAFSDD